MLRRSVLPTTVAALSSSTTTSSTAVVTPARGSLTMHTPKADVRLGKFSFNEQYTEFRNRSGRVPDYGVDKYRNTFWRIDEYVRRSENFIQQQGFFFLPTLDFPWYKGCMPLLSSYQIRVHYSRHHRAYVDKLNQLIEGTDLYGKQLDEIVVTAANDKALTGVFNNAAQHYNHSFFWKCIQPCGSNIPPDLSAAVSAQYGSVEAFEEKFLNAAQNLFGSGWVYWVYDFETSSFDIISYSNAGCPLTNPNYVPLLCVDVWEHAYYIDYENNRAQYLSKFLMSWTGTGRSATGSGRRSSRTRR
ncbi:superoxide dismutase [Angomonas deanei]|nr:superoxide dismutase [Angomonas deanei]|eukprot:EPY32173.1 superoxide dismutase [Angomonas deanei]